MATPRKKMGCDPAEERVESTRSTIMMPHNAGLGKAFSNIYRAIGTKNSDSLADR
jgi:hypothetical protein